jgi:hypothetical protein
MILTVAAIFRNGLFDFDPQTKKEPRHARLLVSPAAMVRSPGGGGEGKANKKSRQSETRVM